MTVERSTRLQRRTCTTPLITAKNVGFRAFFTAHWQAGRQLNDRLTDGVRTYDGSVDEGSTCDVRGVNTPRAARCMTEVQR